ncbi:hypothetical protein FHR81_000800 [Actinoalloteichus hoggarensis]|uniref:Uncharacterized protein n=1 Tax=Actinoalloteichus hoggarensis TaxID=1470176 RepID=A0A221W181_9PSEU|nr:hypothetical protein [Actinoalloteichus hoggarensis]ASO19522.1 hypothetical protein AHOG_09390 [Actinoalloteichus hoggarensis]MBB5919771.1 hypothetical protein [Actinoalloteichus hoggarensis]
MKPWMRRLPDETEPERNNRLARTCCWCGRQDADFPSSDAHESGCARRPDHGRRKAAPEPDTSSEEVP